MSRQARVDLPHYFYHITNRGERKGEIFLKKEDFLVFINYLVELLDELDLELYAYCLIPNHFHLLVYRLKVHLKNFMQRLETRYALYFNQKHSLSGHVYQERYHSFIVLNEKYLKNVLFYIHNNPVKAGIVKKEEDYDFSSASFYHGFESKLPLKKIPEFSGKEGVRKYLQSSKSELSLPIFRDSIGTKEEYLKIEKRKEGRNGNLYCEHRNKLLPDILIVLDDILKKINLSKNTFFIKKGNRFLTETQKKVAITLYGMGYSQSQIARLLNIHKTAIFKLIKKFRGAK